MINLFSIPTDLSYNEKSYFDKYITKSVSKKTEKELDRMNKKIQEIQVKQKPIYSRLAKAFLLGASFAVVIGFMNIFKSSSRAFGIGSFVVCALLVGLSIYFNYLQSKKDRELSLSEEMKSLQEEGDRLVKRVYKELNINSNPTEIDVCLYYYKYDKEGNKVCHFPKNAYFLKEYAFQIENENLLIADVYGVISVPIKSIKSLSKKDGLICFCSWNKQESPFDKKYKEYKIKNIKSGILQMKGYYSVNLELDNKDVEILIPLYEKEKIEKIMQEINK